MVKRPGTGLLYRPRGIPTGLVATGFSQLGTKKCRNPHVKANRSETGDNSFAAGSGDALMPEWLSSVDV